METEENETMVKCYQKDYPRPQLVRQEWQCLNGEWDFAFDDENRGESENWGAGFAAERRIRVPFTYETEAGGIHDETRHDTVWYQRTLGLTEEELAGKRTVLHFEGCDYLLRLWVNGRYAGSHTGAYSRASFDISKHVTAGRNVIVAMAQDSFSTSQPRGKQRWIPENFGCWYVQTTGIWKTVWLEHTPKSYIDAVKITPDLDNYCVRFDFQVVGGPSCAVGAAVSFCGVPVANCLSTLENGRTTMTVPLSCDHFVDKVMEWSPESPNLYDVQFTLTENGAVAEEVGSYFGLRKIATQDARVLLNNYPVYQRLVLDQGYWKETGLTPPSEEALIEDIDKTVQLGYNGVRKHQKVEDERYLFWCDVKGLYVWSEMAATYTFDDDAVECFTEQWMEIVRQNYNHPSIVTWTPFNESWGVPRVKCDRSQQHFTEAIYHLTKAFDPMRPVIVNDGWQHTVSDIISLHDYGFTGESLLSRLGDKEQITTGQTVMENRRSAFADGYEYKGQPIIVSEFGGIALDDGNGKSWGYGDKAAGEEAFFERLGSVVSAIYRMPYVCGFCYTQITDVQQEVNGLMDMERKFKVDPDRVSRINRNVE